MELLPGGRKKSFSKYLFFRYVYIQFFDPIDE